MQLGEMLQTR